HKAKACSQLISAISHFQSCLNFKHYNLEAILCFSYPPRRPAASSSVQANKALLAKMGVSLTEGTEVEFR
ncbi:MAG TPA: hypothetical protein VN040_17170, partial [Pseudosphingobacterium sp.]|nr:hypothetical protein [Pseudosphingobacterium sp.]